MNVNVLDPPVQFRAENVLLFAPKIIAPDPVGDMVKVPYVAAPVPDENVLLDADVSVIRMVEDAPEKVRLVVVERFHTVPVPVSVHVPDPMVSVLVFALELLRILQVTF